MRRYGESRYEITGPPEVREVDPDARYFNPLRDEWADGAAIGNVGVILEAALPLPGASRRVPIAGTAR